MLIEKSNKKIGTKFEEKIKQFLANLGFNDVDGARDTFKINGIQVDVCGGWENALLVIECKTKQKLGRKDLRSAINEIRGKQRLLESGFKKHETYNKYNFFQYILITKNISVKKEDLKFANESHPRIYIWNDDFLEYYSDLYSFIKPYAKYDLLGEMGIKPLAQPPITIPALQIQYGNTNIYNFVINPKDLLEIAFVARRENGRERYYQRIIDKKRLSKIAKYIENGGTFPNNIIIAFRQDLQVKFHRNKGPKYNTTDWPYIGVSFGILEFPKDYRSCWVIDGQHRLYSFVNLKDEFYFHMPITAFENLDLKYQRKFFLDINKNQRPVDSDLLWDLSGDTPEEKDGIVSNIVKALNVERNSPLYHRIYYPSTGIKNKKDKIKISAVCNAIKKNKLIEEVTLQNIKNPLSDIDRQKITKNTALALSRYFTVLKKEFPTNWYSGRNGFILSSGGIGVMISLFEKIIARVMQKSSRLATNYDFETYASPLKKFLENASPSELKKYRLSVTSEGGKSELLNEFILEIRTETNDELFGGEINDTKFKKEFIELEKKLKELIKLKLSVGKGKTWFEQMAEKDMFRKAQKNLIKNGISDENKIYLQIGLGECFSLLRKHKEIFYPILLDEYTNERILEGAIGLVTTQRAILEAHYTGAKIKTDDEQLLKIHLKKFNKCIDKIINNE